MSFASFFYLHNIRNCKNKKFVGITLFFLKKYKYGMVLTKFL